MAVSEKDWNEACRKVIRAAEAGNNSTFLMYGAAYAKAGIGLTGEERHVQSIYILTNIGYWRGEEAKAAREVFKQVRKERW